MSHEPLTHPRARAVARAVLAVAYFGIGIVHVTHPDAFLPIMPDWVPHPREVVLGTGVCELTGAVALMTPRLRRAAGWAFAAYAICVFPANIKHAMENLKDRAREHPRGAADDRALPRRGVEPADRPEEERQRARSQHGLSRLRELVGRLGHGREVACRTVLSKPPSPLR